MSDDELIGKNNKSNKPTIKGSVKKDLFGLKSDKLKENDPYEKCFGFITYKKIAQIASYVEDCSIYIDTPCYVKNSPKLLVLRYEILVDDLEFIETDIIVEDIEPTKYFIKTEFGLLRFIDERTFYLVDRPEEMYFLVGKSLNELMDEGKAIN